MRKQTKLWETADGRRIRICDMTDKHLKNTIAMFDEADTWGGMPWEVDEFWFDYPTIYYNMKEDLERRESEQGTRRRALDSYKESVLKKGYIK